MAENGVAEIESAVRLAFLAKDRRFLRVEAGGGETTLVKHVERFEDNLVPKRVQLTIERILDWADAYHAANGRWPIAAPIPVAEAPGESWDRIDEALRRRERGLSGYSSLADLLAACRGAGNLTGPPRLRIDQILAWADSYHVANGCWPIAEPVAVAEAPEESWEGIDQALRQGERGLPGGSSLTRLLAERRGTRDPKAPPPLDQILAWADAFHAANGRWPIAAPIAVAEAPDESWDRIDQALRRGARAMSVGSSLAHLLAERRGACHPKRLRRLRIHKILGWADAFHAANGRWPVVAPVRVAEASDESWDRIDRALRVGERGLPGGSSLTRLLAERRGTRNPRPLAPLPKG